jgi:BASS family bile acid:Na+ symporter
MFVIMPLFAILLTRIFQFERPVAIALIVLAISPVPPLLPQRVTKAGGLAPYGLGLMVTAGTLSILYIPLAVDLIGWYFHRPFAMGAGAVAKLIIFSVLLPIAAGMVLQRVVPDFARRIAKPAGLVARVLLILCVPVILLFAFPKSLSLIGNGTLMAFIAFIVVGLAVGHFLGGPGPDERVTLALSTACRHPALALAIATANIPQEHDVVGAIMLYLLLNILVSIPYVFRQRRKFKENAAPAAAN